MDAHEHYTGRIASAVFGAALTIPVLPWAFIIAGTFGGVISAGILAIPAAILAVIFMVFLGACAGLTLYKLICKALSL